jgi:hypothetical protein
MRILMRLAREGCPSLDSIGVKASSGSAEGLQGSGRVGDEPKEEKADNDEEMAKAVKECGSMRDVTL